MKTKPSISSRLLKVVKENPEGFSFSLDLQQALTLNYGYMVGLTDNVANSETEIIALYKQYQIIAANLNTTIGDLFVGGWKDTDGTYYFDLSVWVEEREQANSLAIAFNQKAVWDCSTQHAFAA